MKSLIKLSFFFFIYATSANVNAQNFATDATGKPLILGKYGQIDGSVYLFDKWLPGKIVADNGKVYANVMLKYDVYDKALLFEYKADDEPQQFADPIKNFVINAPQAMIFQTGFPAIDSQNEDSFYQVLVKGKANLLKCYTKKLVGSQRVEKISLVGELQNETLFYIFKDNKIKRLSRSKGSILKIMEDKKAEMQDYLMANKPDLSNDVALATLVNYYNELK